MNAATEQPIFTLPPERAPSTADDPAARFLDGGLRRELGLSPEHLHVGLLLARGHMDRGAFADAMRIYITLVLCEPANVDHQIGLANCAHLQNEHNVALQAASAVIALAPADPRGYLLSGRSCLMIGSYKEAQEDLEDAIRLASDGTPIAIEARRMLDRAKIAAAGEPA